MNKGYHDKEKESLIYDEIRRGSTITQALKETDMIKIDVDDIWKFKEKEVRISEMDLISVLKAALHCHKKMNEMEYKIQYYDFKRRFSYDAKYLKQLNKRTESRTKTKMMFAEKLEMLSRRAIELGTQIPDEFEDIKMLLNTLQGHNDKENKPNIVEKPF